MIITINANEYKLCDKGSKNYWCSSKKGIYGRGILNTENDPYRVERIGNLGEFAFAKYMKLDPPAFEYKKGGDDYDFLINGHTIDVKCARKDYGAILIKCETEKGTDVFQKCDIFVCSHVIEDDRKTASVRLVGWVTLDYVLSLPKKESPHWRSQHKNYEVNFNSVNPMDELRSYLQI